MCLLRYRLEASRSKTVEQHKMMSQKSEITVWNKMVRTKPIFKKEFLCNLGLVSGKPFFWTPFQVSYQRVRRDEANLMRAP